MNDTDSTGYFSLPYDTVTWLSWIALAFLLALFRRWRGIILAQIAVATTILMLHFRWSHSSMHQWEGNSTVKVDIFLMVLAIGHSVVVGIILFPVSALGLMLAPRRNQPGTKKAADPGPPPLPPSAGDC